MTTSSEAIVAPPAGSYCIEPGTSEIALSAKHLFGLATVHGAVSIVSGQFTVAADVFASHAEVTASAASFDTGDERRDRAVRAPRFLDVQRSPSMHFRSATISHEDGRFVVSGVLTANRVNAPLRLTVTRLEAGTDGVTVQATGRVDRYRHKITAARGMAGRTIDLRITVHAVRHTPTD